MYLAILGRQSDISLAELEAQFHHVKKLAPSLATFDADTPPDINRLGGSLKLACKLSQSPLKYLSGLPAGKITLGISNYTPGASAKSSQLEALKLKKILVRHDRSVRVVESKSAVLSTATSLHNGLSGHNDRKVELIKLHNTWYRVIGVQDIDAYAHRDQARPARDAKVGMLPPKLAQVLINLCGPLTPGSTILDPFCGTGVLLQEALLMGYHPYGTDISDRMVEYSEKNLEWLLKARNNNLKQFLSEHCDQRGACSSEPRNDGREREREESNLFQINAFQISQGDATLFSWNSPIDAVACEGYLGQPMSQIPAKIKLKQQQQECSSIILGFLRNLSKQIQPDTPVVIAIPAWLRNNNEYERLNILDEITSMGYNVNNKSREGLLYARTGQIVARDIIILRKK